MKLVKVYRKGIVVLPKDVREKAGVREGMLLAVRAEEGRIVLEPADLWSRVWGCAKGLGKVDEVERELDLEEEHRLGEREWKR